MKTLTGSTLALALVGACMSAQAADAATPSTTEPSALTVVRDAATGKLRAPTAEEAAALQPPAARGLAALRVATPLLRSHADGAKSMRMTNDMMTQAVAVRAGDGRLVSQCYDSKQAAELALSINSPSASGAAKE